MSLHIFLFFFNFLFILLRKFFYNDIDMYFCSCFSVTHSCLTLCYPMDCNMPSILVHLLTEFAQTNVHQVGDAIQPSHPLLSLFLLPSIFPSSKVFSNELALPSGGQTIGASASASIPPMNTQGWFPLGFTGLISLQFLELS